MYMRHGHVYAFVRGAFRFASYFTLEYEEHLGRFLSGDNPVVVVLLWLGVKHSLWWCWC